MVRGIATGLDWSKALYVGLNCHPTRVAGVFLRVRIARIGAAWRAPRLGGRPVR